MKIIVAEKISASAVAQLQEPGWTVLTADQLDGKLARATGNGGRADRAIGGTSGCQATGACETSCG